jgi:hypothetical protein
MWRLFQGQQVCRLGFLERWESSTWPCRNNDSEEAKH